jgi:hypothetical protein
MQVGSHKKSELAYRSVLRLRGHLDRATGRGRVGGVVQPLVAAGRRYHDAVEETGYLGRLLRLELKAIVSSRYIDSRCGGVGDEVQRDRAVRVDEGERAATAPIRWPGSIVQDRPSVERALRTRSPVSPGCPTPRYIR